MGKDTHCQVQLLESTWRVGEPTPKPSHLHVCIMAHEHMGTGAHTKFKYIWCLFKVSGNLEGKREIPVHTHLQVLEF